MVVKMLINSPKWYYFNYNSRIITIRKSAVKHCESRAHKRAIRLAKGMN